MASNADNPNLDRVIADFLERSRSGKEPDRQALLESHPEFAAELKSFFANHDGMKGTTSDDVTVPPAPVRGDATVAPNEAQDDATIPPNRSRTPSEDRHPKVRYFGDYELLEEIARGGMGVVYKARQVNLNRIVALKMILAGQLAGQEDVQRFHAEAEAAANLDHPGIVPIYEVGEHEGQHYFSMGYVEGESLADKIKDGPLSPREAAEYGKKVAEAISFAHERGVIHRDLKPANVLLDRFGRPKVTDFGLAKRVEGDSGLTATGQILGTPSYMPPEQASGQLTTVDETADVYSLGAVLYALLTGRPPFQSASPVDTLMQVLDREPIPARQLNAEVPRDLETITAKCLEKATSRRYSSAAQVADELERFLNGETIRARPVGVPTRTWRWCCRKPGAAAFIATLLVLILTFSIGGPMFAIQQRQFARRQAKLRRQAEVAEASEREQRQRADNQATEALRQKERAEWQLYVNNLASAQREWEGNDVALAMDYLNGCQPEMRGWEHSYLLNKYSRGRLELLRHSKPVSSVAYSLDGSLIASGSTDGTVKIWDAENGRERVTFAVGGMVGSVAFSPDGTRVVCSFLSQQAGVWDAVSGDKELTLPGRRSVVSNAFYSGDGSEIIGGSVEGEITTWDADTGREIATFDTLTEYLRLALTNNASRFVVGGDDGALSLWEVTSGKNVLAWKGHDGQVTSVASTTDGKWIVSGGEDGIVKLWDALSGDATHTLRGHEQRVRTVAFSPDGSRAASGGDDTAIRVWDVEGGQQTLTLRGHRDMVMSLAFSPDGTRLVSSSYDNSVIIWDLEEQGDLTLNAHDITLSASFSPDSSRIVSGSYHGEITLWDASSGETVFRIKGHGPLVNSVMFSPDGSQILSGGDDNSIRLWNADSGKAIAAIEVPGTSVDCARFSPDGTRIVCGSGDGTITVWNAESGAKIRSFREPARVASIDFSPDGSRLVTGIWGLSNNVTIWNPATAERSLVLAGHQKFVNDLDVDATGKRAASAGNDKVIKLWDLDRAKEVRVLQGHDAKVSSVAFSPDGKRLVSASFDVDLADNTVRVWNVETADEVLRLEGHSDRITSVAFSPDGKKIVSASYDNTLKVWDANQHVGLSARTDSTPDAPLVDDAKTVSLRGILDGRKQIPSLRLQGHASEVKSVAFSSDGSKIVSNSADKSIRVWDPASGKERLRLDGITTSSVALSPDGSKILGGGDGVRAWDAVSGEELFSVTGHTDRVMDVAFSPSGDRFVSGSMDKTLKVWDTASRKELRTLSGHSDFVLSVAFSPDGTRIASSSIDGTVRLWSSDSGETIHTLASHGSPVTCVVFSSDGRKIASGDNNGVLKTWDVLTGQEALSVEHVAGVRCVAFNSDGEKMLSGDSSGWIKFWDADTGELLHTLMGHAGAVYDIALSPDGTRLVSCSSDHSIRVWELSETISRTAELVKLRFFAGPNRQQAADLGARSW